MCARYLDGAFHRFCPAVGKEGAPQSGQARQFERQRTGIGVIEQIAYMQYAGCLILDGAGQLRMVVSESVDRYACQKIEVLFAAFFVQIDAFTAHRFKVRFLEDRKIELLLELFGRKIAGHRISVPRESNLGSSALNRLPSP